MNKKDSNSINIVKVLTLSFMVLLMPISSISAQETKVVKDLELWTGIALDKKLNKHWEINFKQEIRFREDASKINNIFSQVGVDYKINSYFTLEGRYRYIKSQNSKLNYEDHSRYSLSMVYDTDIWDLSIKYRLRYQKKVQSLNVFNLNEPSEQRVRNKIQFGYTGQKRIEPYISAELFLLQSIYNFPKYDIMRYQAGIKYNPKKIGKFRLAYSIDKELNAELPYTHYILSLNYSYSF